MGFDWRQGVQLLKTLSKLVRNLAQSCRGNGHSSWPLRIASGQFELPVFTGEGHLQHGVAALGLKLLQRKRTLRLCESRQLFVFALPTQQR